MVPVQFSASRRPLQRPFPHSVNDGHGKSTVGEGDRFHRQSVRFGASQQPEEKALLPGPQEVLSEQGIVSQLMGNFPFLPEVLGHASSRVNQRGATEISTSDFIEALAQPALFTAKNLAYLRMLQDKPNPSEMHPLQVTGYLEILKAFLPEGTDLNHVSGASMERSLTQSLQQLQGGERVRSPRSPQDAKPPKAHVSEEPQNPLIRLVMVFLKPIIRLIETLTGMRLTTPSSAASVVSGPNLPFSQPMKQLFTGLIQQEQGMNRNPGNLFSLLLASRNQPGTPAELNEAARFVQDVREWVTLSRDESGDGEETDTPEYFQSKLTDLQDKGLINSKQTQIIQGFITKLKRHNNPMDPNASLYKAWLEDVFQLPWEVKTSGKEDALPIQKRLAAIQEALDADHFGMEEVKEEIIQQMGVSFHLKALQKAQGKQLGTQETVKPKIICLVGPPGVGKTSIGKSIARSMGKPFERISLGGVNDEPEIRGHRPTYMGALPGKIMKAFKEAGTQDPVIMLDEIDKLGRSQHNGDPAAALLEVLDPEQNHSFEDHYYGLPYDLSKATFITTANTLEDIPEPLRDRMEIVYLDGYYPEQKCQIAKEFLIPKIRRSHGLTNAALGVLGKAESFDLSDDVLNALIQDYAPGRGVRILEQYLEKIGRKLLIDRQRNGFKGPLPTVTVDNLSTILKRKAIPTRRVAAGQKVGQTHGLYYSNESALPGGVIPFLVKTDCQEAQSPSDRGFFLDDRDITGNMKEVMKESVRNAFGYVRTHAETLGLTETLAKNRVNILLQAGDSIEKDGPSAGVAITTALVSALTQKPVPANVAMTGEIDLEGNINRIGGLGWKLMGATRQGVKTAFVPEENRRDYEALPNEAKEEIQVKFVSHMDQILKALKILPSTPEASTTGSP